MKFLLFVMIISASISMPSQARELYISSGFTPPLTYLFERVLTELDRRLDSVDLIFKPMEAERSVKLVQAGINDGDCCRVPAVFEDDELLVFVPTSFASIRWNVFARDQSLTIRSFEDLKPHVVGTVAGWKLAVNKIRQISPEHYQILDTPEQMFQMISRQRLDVGVIGYLNGLNELAKLNIKDIYALQPPLAETPLHIMLAAKNSDLVPEIDVVLQQMIQDGTIARIQKSLEMEYLGR